jgi:hypothetical protein
MQSSTYGTITTEIMNEAFRQPVAKKIALTVKQCAHHSFQKIEEAITNPVNFLNICKSFLPFGRKR